MKEPSVNKNTTPKRSMPRKNEDGTEQTLSLLVSFDSGKSLYPGEKGFCHFNLRPITLTDYGKPRNLSLWDYEVNGLTLGDLKITSQGNNDDAPVSEGDSRRNVRHLYAYAVGYWNVNHVSARDADRMSKTLRTIHRRLAAIEERDGPYLDFAQYVERVAEAIGCDGVTYYTDQRSGSYDASTFETVSVSEGASKLARLIGQWRAGDQVDLVA
jgi:hypothetical protein